MKKTLLLLALMPAMAMAQTELPNGSFEGTWGDCTPWTAKKDAFPESANTSTMAGGAKMETALQPESWTIANVIGIGGLGATQVGEQIEGYNSDKAVKLYNVANIIMATQIVPGYITLGTSWNTSVMGNKNDGGSFGGIQFTGRPDALSFQYKRSHAVVPENAKDNIKETYKANEPFTVVAYTWVGSTWQKNVPADIAMFGNPTKVEMKNRDRNILDIPTMYGEEITKSEDFKLVASINDSIYEEASDWTQKTVEFTYTDKKLVPEMMNVIFSAGSYFNAKVGCGNELSVDDVKLVYYSRLSTITLGGEEIEGFDPNVFDYTITLPAGSDPDDALFDIECKALGYAATKSENGDADDYKIKVTNPDGADADGLSEHTYHLHFKVAAAPVEPEGQKIDGLLDITMMGMPLAEGDAKSVYLNDHNDGTADFVLPNFSLVIGGAPLELGNISVPNLKVYRDEANARTYYEGKVDRLVLAGIIVAKVDVYGYIADNGEVNLKIPVTWLQDETNEESWVPIDVRFYTAGVSADNDPQIPTAISRVATAVRGNIYDLQGRQRQTLTRGLNIVNGKKVIK